MIQWTTPGGNTNGKWHNRGNVWDTIATEWAGEDEWISKRRNETSSAVVLNRMNLSNCPQESKRNRRGETRLKKPPRKSGPADANVYTREDGPTVRWLASGHFKAHISGTQFGGRSLSQCESRRTEESCY